MLNLPAFAKGERMTASIDEADFSDEWVRFCASSDPSIWKGREVLDFPVQKTIVAPFFSKENPHFRNWKERKAEKIIPNPTHFSTEGVKTPRCRIGGINGINTTRDQARAHADYIAQFVPDRSIDWLHNRSHGPIADLAEIVSLNYAGFSPGTGRELLKAWISFDEENRECSEAKYLQVCHSQGAIHVRNALLQATERVRDRVIVVAIAPAAVVSKELCFQSYNYASKRDFLVYGELAHASAFDTNEFGISKNVERALENIQELIFLEPHPSAIGLDHDFQSPTFADVCAAHLQEYVAKYGESK